MTNSSTSGAEIDRADDVALPLPEQQLGGEHRARVDDAARRARRDPRPTGRRSAAGAAVRAPSGRSRGRPADRPDGQQRADGADDDAGRADLGTREPDRREPAHPQHDQPDDGREHRRAAGGREWAGEGADRQDGEPPGATRRSRVTRAAPPQPRESARSSARVGTFVSADAMSRSGPTPVRLRSSASSGPSGSSGVRQHHSSARPPPTSTARRPRPSAAARVRRGRGHVAAPREHVGEHPAHAPPMSAPASADASRTSTARAAASGRTGRAPRRSRMRAGSALPPTPRRCPSTRKVKPAESGNGGSDP